MTVDVLFDAGAQLAEGPVWDPLRRSLTWVDILEGAVHRLGLDGTPGPTRVLGRRVGAAVPCADGETMILATDAGFARLDDAGALEPVAPVSADAPDWFMNDGRCDALGRFWAGTVAIAPDGSAVPGGGALHRLDPGGAVTAVRGGVTLSNGIDWSPDGRTLYYVDSLSGGIDAYDFDLEHGAIGEPRRIVDTGPDPGAAFADGICVDADGGIWAAIWGTGEVRRYTPAGGLDRAIAVPASQPTSCAFAGDSLDLLVITSAWLSLTPEARAREPLAGAIFACTPGPRGRPEHLFAG